MKDPLQELRECKEELARKVTIHRKEQKLMHFFSERNSAEIRTNNTYRL